jgi:DNA repair protein RecN (Recombination protein N)
MLKSIYIDNYALIDRLEINLNDGLTIITGETGAGKSILLGALGLLLGKRADTSVLKDKSRKCIVEGIFAIEDYQLEPLFIENELDYSSETLIRREISNKGSSRAFINDTPVNLNLLQEISLRLIDIHSQHQNLLLNDEDYLRWIIDSYAGTKTLLTEYQVHYQEFHKLRSNFQAVRSSYEQDKQNLDFLTHQLNELQSARLKENELEELEQELDLLSHTEEIKSSLNNAAILLQEEGTGIVTIIKQVHDLLNRISSHYTYAGELKNRVNNTYIELKDISEDVVQHFDRLEYDPERMEFLAARIDELYTLLRKHKKENIAELIVLRNSIDEKLQKVAVADYKLEKLEAELQEKQTKMLSAASTLSEKRQTIFPEFSKRVVHLLDSIGMENTRFSVRHTHKEAGKYGTDGIEFLFSANRSMGLQAINKVASGGELSRLMLAIKYLISSASGLPAIIFDEIDTGVSGEIADMVGNLIKEMSAGMQVINITHLPQVASKGDYHYLVYKQSDNGESRTLIKELNKHERLNEIAKMLSGDSVTDEAIENARVLLKSN